MADSPTSTVPRPASAPRARRSAAAVIARYIQELTSPSEPVPCSAAA
jgi:hypothetical protein